MAEYSELIISVPSLGLSLCQTPWMRLPRRMPASREVTVKGTTVTTDAEMSETTGTATDHHGMTGTGSASTGTESEGAGTLETTAVGMTGTGTSASDMIAMPVEAEAGTTTAADRPGGTTAASRLSRWAEDMARRHLDDGADTRTSSPRP